MRALSLSSTATRGLALPATAALLLALTACGGGKDSDDTPGADGNDAAETSTTSAPEEVGLSFDLVEQTVSGGFPDCAYGVFSENSTGVTGEQADAVEFFRQYDCWESQEAAESLLGGFPELIQQVIYVEFSDEAAATSYAAEQAVLYRTITDGMNVVVLGTGADQTTMNGYGDALLTTCTACTEVTG